MPADATDPNGAKESWLERLTSSGAARLAATPVQNSPTDPLGRPLCDWTWRVIASMVDVVVFTVVVTTVVRASGLHRGVAPFVELALAVLYLGAMIGTKGRTIGAWCTKVMVVDAETGQPATMSQAMLRAAVQIGCLLTILLFFVDCAWPLWDPRRQTLHDKAARTLAVRTGSFATMLRPK